MSILTWLHIGDLHVSADDRWEGLRRFEELVALADAELSSGVDFAVLPGDNANNGTPEQYRRLRAVCDRLRMPCHAIPGDHDFEPGSLAAFHEVFGAAELPRRIEVKGRACLLLDLVSAGAGGPDFRLGERQAHWLEAELDRAPPPDVVFMHAYPGDMTHGGEYWARRFAQRGVRFVDTGHTHYNELLNDGHVIYAATRSTGQIEEDDGAPGFALVTLDGEVVSWRFQRLDGAWPLVQITSPGDRRLVTSRTADATRPETCAVRAKVFGSDVRDVTLSVDGERQGAMLRQAGEPALWQLALPGLADGWHRLKVEARGKSGSGSSDAIEIDWPPRPWTAKADTPGTDAHTIGAWPEHGLLGTQLGPNKNGHGW